MLVPAIMSMKPGAMTCSFSGWFVSRRVAQSPIAAIGRRECRHRRDTRIPHASKPGRAQKQVEILSVKETEAASSSAINTETILDPRNVMTDCIGTTR
jgi:hypothetical protein